MAQQKKGFLHNLIVGKDKAEGYARASLPSNRWELFWDVLKGRFWKLIILNLMVVLAMILPVMLYIFMTASIGNAGADLPYSAAIGGGYPVMPDVSLLGLSMEIQIKNMAFTLLIPALLVAAVVLSGVFYIMRNLVWEEGVFMANDFWKGFKDNILFFLVIMLIEGVVLWLTNYSLNSVAYLDFLGQGSWFFTVSKYITVVVAVFITIMVFYMMTLTVTYKLTLWQLIRNSFILTLGLLPQNLFFLVLCFAPLLLVLLFPPLITIGLMIYLVIGFSGAILGWTTYNHWVYDKFINDKVPGAQKNRGIYQKVDMQGQPIVKKVRTSKLIKKRPLKPVTDEEITLDLPATFTRADLAKLQEEKERMAEDAERWSIEHENDPEVVDESLIIEEGDDESYEQADDAMKLEGADEKTIEENIAALEREMSEKNAEGKGSKKKGRKK